MNYYVTRFLILAILIVMFYLVTKYLFKMKYEKRKLTIKESLFIVIIGIIIWTIPYESIINIHFRTVNGLFKYYHPFGRIIKNYEYKDYTYVLYYDDESIDLIYYLKDSKNRWFLEKQSNVNIKTYDQVTIITNEIPSKNVIAIFVTYIDQDKKIKISDSISSEFDTVDNVDPILKKVPKLKDFIDDPFVRKVAIIEKKDDYKLFLDEKEYIPF